ncbi:MAG: ankyrin repeat domain-containing protein [Candidatus Hydrogenedentota bacterium]
MATGKPVKPTKPKRKFKFRRRKLDVPGKILASIFLSAVALTVVLAHSAPNLYRTLTKTTFEEAMFIDNYKDRIYSYGTHSQLRSIQIGSTSTTVNASNAGRRLDQIMSIYNNGQDSVSLFALLSGILGGTALVVLLIYPYSKGKQLRTTNVIAIVLIAAVITMNLTNVLYRSSLDKQEYQPSQPFIRGSLALLVYISIQQNAPELLSQLIGMGAPVDAVDNEKGSYMHHVARLNRTNMFALVMSIPGVNIDDRSVAGETPIQIATEKGYVDIVTLLLKSDVDAENKDSRGQTLLHRAAINSDIPMMKILLEHVDTLNTPDVDGITPLSLAVRNVDMEMILLLLENRIDVNTQVDESYTFFELVLSTILGELRASPDYVLEEEEKVFGTIKQAIEQDAHLSGQDNDGKTPLHWVTRLHDSITDPDEGNSFLKRVTFLLLENGADYAVLNNSGERAITLEHVIRHDYDDWLSPVIKADPDYLNQATINGRSLFQYAIELGNSETLSVLFEHGLEPKDWVPKTLVPLKFVVQKNDLATARLLLEQHLVKPDSEGMNSSSPLHVAATLNQDRMIELLLEFGYDVNRQGVDGNTPLHYAVETESTFSILALLENGADPLMWNSDGLRPIDHARNLGVPAILDVVKKAADNFKQVPPPAQ